MLKKIILTIDDEEHILDLLCYHLERAGYQMLRAQSGEEGLEILSSQQVDFVLLDVLLPGIDGFEVLKTIRTTPNLAHLPIIMLSAKGEEIDKVLGLEMGADDYMSKPFGMHELQARIKAVLRRARMAQTAAISEETLLIGGLRLNRAYREVLVEGEAVSLSHKEFEVLYTLASHRGRVFTREQLIERIWGFDYDGEPRTVDVHVRNLRKKIETDPDAPVYIQTVRGMGYKCG